MRLRSPPLFWRTFLLILLLFVACLAAWWPTVRVIEREPRARQIAQLVVSIVNTTRSALVYSDPQRRRYLLSDLAGVEGFLAGMAHAKQTDGGDEEHAGFGKEFAAIEPIHRAIFQPGITE